MTLGRPVPLGCFLLLVSLCGLVHADTIVTIENPAIFGDPGAVAGWGFDVTADPGIYPLFTGSVFSPDPNAAGTYSDYLASSFVYGSAGSTVADSFDSSAFTGAGEFDIDPLALTGTSVQGTLTIYWDEYTVSPGDPNFDPIADLSTSGDSASLAVSVAVGDQPVPVIATPEPGTISLIAIPIAFLLWKLRRKSGAAAGALAAGAIVLISTHAAHAQVPIVDPNDVYPLNVLRFPFGPDGSNKCHPYGDATNVTGCCGSPGALGCTGPLLPTPFPGGSCTTAPPGNASRQDGYDGIALCNLPTATCDPLVNESLNGSSSTSVNGPQDLTFYFTSDIHFDRGGYPLEGQVNHVHFLNTLANQQIQWTFQHDYIGPPLGVVIGGDIGTDGTAPNLGGYRTLFERGTLSPGSLNYPVFFGLGNHETVTEVGTFEAHRMWDYLHNRMGSCAVNFDSASGNYSWDWGRMHLVMLNTWAADQTNLWAGSFAANGLQWLANDLQTHASDGRPVVVFQHYEFNGSFYNINTYVPFDLAAKVCIQNLDQCETLPHGGCGAGWTFKDATNFLNTLAPYNVVGIFAGHTHEPSVDAIESTFWAQGIPNALQEGDKNYCNTGSDSGTYSKNTFTSNLNVPLDVFTNGTGSAGNTGDFFTVRYSEGQLQGSGAAPGMPPTLEVEMVHWTPNGITKGLVGNPSTDPPNSVGTDFYGGMHACRKAIDTTFHTLTPQVNLSVTYDPHPGSNPGALPAYAVVVTAPAGLILPPALAIRVRFPTNRATLANPSFLDRCGDATSPYTTAIPNGSYIPFSVSQLGQPISLPIVIDPYKDDAVPQDFSLRDIAVDLVAMSPLGGIAGPNSVTVSLPESQNPNQVQQTFTIWGPPNAPFNLSTSVAPIILPGGTALAQNWFSSISATPCPSPNIGTWCFDSDGVATITVSMSPANFFAQATGGASMTITVTGLLELPFTLSIPFVINAPIGSTPAAVSLTAGPGSAPTSQVSFVLNGPPGTPFTITANYQALYDSTTGGPAFTQTWADKISTNSPALAFCQQGHVICFGPDGHTTVTIGLDVAQVLGFFTPRATATFQINSIDTDPHSAAYFSLPVPLVVNTNAAPRIDVTLPAQPFPPGGYGLMVATLVEPNSIEPLYLPQPAGQMNLFDVTLDSNGNRTGQTELASGAIDTFCFANPHGGTTDVAPNWPFYAVVFGGSYPTMNDYCPATSLAGGGAFLLSSLSTGLHHLQFGYHPSNENFAPVSSPIVDFLVQPVPAAITPLSGSGQAAIVGSSFAQPLQAKVTSANGTPLYGIAVQFSAPTSQPTATFAGQPTATVVTDTSGVATSPVLTSGLSAGAFQVSASVTGVATPAVFNLTTASLPASPQLTASISSKSGALNARLWTVKVADSQGAASSVSIASISFAQVAGAACTPVVDTALPIALGSLASGASASAPVTVDFSTCASSARFTVQIAIQSNGGSYQKTTTIGNQFP